MVLAHEERAVGPKPQPRVDSGAIQAGKHARVDARQRADIDGRRGLDVRARLAARGDRQRCQGQEHDDAEPERHHADAEGLDPG